MKFLVEIPDAHILADIQAAKENFGHDDTPEEAIRDLLTNHFNFVTEFVGDHCIDGFDHLDYPDIKVAKPKKITKWVGIIFCDGTHSRGYYYAEDAYGQIVEANSKEECLEKLYECVPEYHGGPDEGRINMMAVFEVTSEMREMELMKIFDQMWRDKYITVHPDGHETIEKWWAKREADAEEEDRKRR